MSRRQPSRCHANSGFLWDANRDKLELCTGYALSEDGLWRQHSWCWWPAQRKVVETTERRKAYVGFVMTAKRVEQFYYDNCI